MGCGCGADAGSPGRDAARTRAGRASGRHDLGVRAQGRNVSAARRRPPRGGRRTSLQGSTPFALLVSASLWLPAAAAAELPKTGKELVATLRGAIESRDYERIEALVNWDGAGTI